MNLAKGRELKFPTVLRLDTTIFLIFVAALLVRLSLAYYGGVGFFPDEIRYQKSIDALELILRGRYSRATIQLIGGAEHILFRVIGLIPAALAKIFGFKSSGVAVTFFSVISAANVILIAELTRRLGGDLKTQRIAAFLFLTSGSMTYYSRHLLPYDTALFFGLFAWISAIKSETQPTQYFKTGLFSGLCFLTYNGYWLIGAAACIWVAIDSKDTKNFLIRSTVAFFGLATPILFTFLVAELIRLPLYESYLYFSKSVTQGDFFEGHAVIWGYLLHAEGLILLVWLYGFIEAERDLETRNKLLSMTFGLVFILFSLIFCSAILKMFVVYGRTTRQLIPFIVIIAAFGIAQRHEKIRAACAILMLCLFSLFIKKATSLTFPDKFKLEAIELLTKRGKKLVLPYKLINVAYFYPEPEVLPSQPYRQILVADHPLWSFKPYLYESLTTIQREKIMTLHPQMQLLALD